MKSKKQYIEAIPAYWLSYLINGERGDILLNEFVEIQNFEKSLLNDCNHFVIDPFYEDDNESYFGQYNGIGHDLIDVQITQF